MDRHEKRCIIGSEDLEDVYDQDTLDTVVRRQYVDFSSILRNGNLMLSAQGRGEKAQAVALVITECAAL